MSALLKVALGLSLLFSVAGHSETEAEFRTQVEAVTKTFKRFDKDYFKFLTRGEGKESVAAYAEAMALIEKIGNDGALAEGPKSEMLLTLASECGAMFERLTEPFADVASEPSTWNDLRAEMGKPGVGNWFVRIGRYSWDRVWWHSHNYLRDFLRLWPLHFDEAGKLFLHWPFALPFGSDWNRSRAASKTMKETVATLKKEMERASANEKDNAGLKAMIAVMKSMETAEPIKWGPANRRFRLFLFWIAAPYMLLNPPIDFWWFSIGGPQQFSLLVSSFFEVAATLYLGRVRRHDAATDAYWHFNRARKLTNGKPVGMFQSLMAWSRLSQVPGLEWLGTGLRHNEELAKAYQSCAGTLDGIGQVVAQLDQADAAAAEEPVRRRRRAATP